MHSDFTLELKKKQSDNNIFYRYSYETCKIWFDQDQITGNIYRVNVVDRQYPDVDYYVDDIEDRCYPINVRLDFPRMFIRSDSDFESANKKLQDCCMRRSAIEHFLLSKDHYKLWLEKHGKLNKDI